MAEPIQDIIAQFQAEIAAEEAAAAQRLLDAYTRIYGKLQTEVNELVAELGTAMADGQTITKAELYRSVRYQRLIEQTQIEMQKYAAILEHEVARAQQAAAEKALADSTAMVQAQLAGIPEPIRGQLLATFNQMPRDAIQAMVGALQESSPLNGLLQTFGADAAKGIGDALVDGLLRGDNPLEVGALIRREFGVPLTRALTISRTEMLRAYRMATWSNYRNNAGVVRGWRWFAQLDNRTCFPRGTLIATERGAVSIEHVRVGDRVLTHTGTYRRVSETMRRNYRGSLMRVTAGDRAVRCTPEHPLLIQRHGQLKWVEARYVHLTDGVCCDADGSSDVTDHVLSQGSIESGVWNADNGVAVGLEPQRLAGIALSHRFEVVPVSAVDFEDGIDVGQVEVNGITPSGESVFLQETDAQRFKGGVGISFGFSLARMCTIAPERAEGLVIGRHGAEVLPAGRTSLDDGRTPAGLGAMFAARILRSKDLAASLAGFVKGFAARALDRTVSEPGGVALGYGEHLATFRARFRDRAGKMQALLRAMNMRARRAGLELVTALGAYAREFRSGAVAVLGVRMPLLEAGVAVRGAEFAATSFHGSGRHMEWIAALDARPIHADSISRMATRSQVVYNLEVETDHTYVANGIVVHNCMSCVAQHGTLHTLDETLDDHPAGRCVMLPETVSMAELGLDVPETRMEIESGESWFRGLPEVEQRAMMGPGKFDAWRSGRFEFSALSRESHSDKWGRMFSETSLRDLLAPAA